MIKSSITVHDKTRIEAVVDYDLEELEAGPDRYMVDTYFYFPPQFEVTEKYTRDQFYRDVHAYIRLKEPILPYRGYWRPVGDRVSPILQLQSRLLENPMAENHNEIIDQIRIYGCLYVSYYLRTINNNIKRLNKQPRNPEPFLSGLYKVIGRGRKLLKELRDLRTKVAGVYGGSYEKFLKELDIVIEYCSYVFRDGATFAAERAEKQDVEQIGITKKLRHFCRVVARYEFWMAKKVGYLWLEGSCSEEYKERYISRKGALRKRIGEVLSLNLKEKPLFALQQQGGYMLAAGLAAAWAISIQIILWHELSIGGIPDLLGSDSFGNLMGMAIVIFVLIGAYVLKDRIKENSRNFFRRGLLGRLPDHRNGLYFDALEGPQQIGSVDEICRLLGSRRDVEPEIQKFRKTAFEYLSVPGEQVVHYSRGIVLDSKRLARLDPPFPAVRDIMRFNFDRFLSSLDDSRQTYVALDRRGNLDRFPVPKTYFVDIIINSRKRGRNKMSTLDAYRLHLNKNGLIRVERYSKPDDGR